MIMKLRSAALVLAVLATGLVACEPRELPDPCANGCEVQTEPHGAPGALYVPQCQDVDGQTGPCVGTVGDSGMWIYVPEGNRWPLGQRIDACPSKDGGPVPCAWVIDPTGGDAGVYVYGIQEV